MHKSNFPRSRTLTVVQHQHSSYAPPLFSQPHHPPKTSVYARFQHQDVGVQGAPATTYL